MLKSLLIPISLAIEALPLLVASSQLGIVTLTLRSKSDYDSVEIGSQVWEVMEERLCPLAEKFSNAHPGKKMKVDIDAIVKGSHGLGVLTILGDKRFLPKLKEEAEVLIPPHSAVWERSWAPRVYI